MKAYMRILLEERTAPKAVEETYRTTLRDPCEGKVVHTTMSDAQATVKRMLERKGAHLTAYACVKCGQIHTGHTFEDHRLDGHPMPVRS